MKGVLSMANTKKQHSEAEIADLTAKFAQAKQYAQQAKDALQLVDLANTSGGRYTVYNKESLRTALQNPLSEQNSKTLRQLSQFLYHLSSQYRRIIAYYASQVDLTAYTVVPNISMTEEVDAESMLSNYENVLRMLEKMNMPMRIYNILVSTWREDVFYGYIYYEEGEQDLNQFIIAPLNGDYCRISSVNYDGTLNFAFDFSFFTGANEAYLQWWDKEFTTLYNKYKADPKLRWQELSPDRTVCFKANYDQTDRVIPPFAPLLESIIDLVDLRAIVNVQDQLDIYKLLVAKIDTLSGTQDVDDFAIALTTAVEFYNKMLDVLPDQIGLVLSPMTIEPITFDRSATDNTNAVSTAMENVFASSGGSQVLDSKRLTGSSAVRAALIADGLMATRPLLHQIEARVNRFLDFVIPNNGMRVKYMEDVTPFTKEEKIKQVKEAATLGVAGSKLMYSSLMGISPLDSYALGVLENDVLRLHEKWMPLQTSYTQGANEGGRPESDITEISDDGEASIDKRDRAG